MISFLKFSGAENSFFITEDPQPAGFSPKDIAKKVEGSDGFIFLTSQGTQDYHWDFYNSDGSIAEMCGNAARCVLSYLNYKKGLSQVNIETLAGFVSVSSMSTEDDYRVQINNVRVLEKSKSVLGEKGFWVNTGVPHFVIEKPLAQARRLSSRKIRAHKALGARGANVTYVEALSENFILAVSYERGVEDFTPACGTGALAAAAYFYEKRPDEKEFFIAMPGGILCVTKEKNSWWLEGEAHNENHRLVINL